MQAKRAKTVEVAAALPMKKYVEIAKAAHPKQK